MNCRELVFSHNFSEHTDFTTLPAVLQIGIHHLCLNSVLCLGAIIINTWRAHIINTRSGRLPMVKQVLMYGCAYDVIFSAVHLWVAPVIVVGYNFIVVYPNTPLRVPGEAYHVLLAVLTTTTIGFSFTIIPAQFVWRYHVILYEKKPDGKYLHAMITCLGWYTMLLIAASGAVFAPPHTAFKMVGYNLLRAHGYNVKYAAEVKVVPMDDPFFLVLKYVFAFGLLFHFVAMLTMDQLVSASWRNDRRYASEQTAKMFDDIRRTFRVLTLSPVLTGVLPLFVLLIDMNRCVTHPYRTCGLSLLLTCQSIVNFFTTVLLIKPYREYLKYWLGLNTHEVCGHAYFNNMNNRVPPPEVMISPPST